MANPNWKKGGPSPNPKGSPLLRALRDAKDKFTVDQIPGYQQRAKDEGLEDPILYLHRRMSDPNVNEHARDQIALQIASFFHCKKGSAPPDLVYFRTKVELPHPRPTTQAQVRENILHVSDLKLSGKIDRDGGDNIIADQKVILASLLEEDKLRGDAGDSIIEIRGGLPPLPGTQITMPDFSMNPLNGHVVDPGKLIDADAEKSSIEAPAPRPPPVPESSPTVDPLASATPSTSTKPDPA
jgi:hypothetical protein